MKNSSRFWNKVAESYAKKPVADEASYQKKLKVTREYFKPDMEVLEFGCGSGSTSISHSPYVSHIDAIDYSSKMIEIAKHRAEQGNIKNVTFSCTTLDEIAAPGKTYDAVLGLNVLHLMSNWKEVIAMVYNMLPPGGVFVTSTACMGDMGIFGLILKIVSKTGSFLGVIPLLEIFTLDELKSSLVNAGFDIEYSWQPSRNKTAFIVAKKLG